LHAALQRIEKTRFDRLDQDTAWLRTVLREAGFDVLAEARSSAPAVLTLRLQQPFDSKSLGQRLEQSGYLLSFGSEYLLQRNWMQICLMGEYSRETLMDLLKELVALRQEIAGNYGDQ
jgi:aspartate aminotransferase-like enzyme